MPFAGPIVTGHPPAMSHTGKFNGSIPAAIMQAFYQLLLYGTQTFGSVSPFGLRMGVRSLAVPISDMAKLSANKIIILWRPIRSIRGGLVG